MRQRTKPASRGAAGFTIVELLVATAVTAVLIGLMITMTSGVLTAWNRTSGTLTANNQGKIILDQVAQDLQAAVFRHDPENPNAVGLAVEILDEWPRGGGHSANLLQNQRWWVAASGAREVFKPTRTQDDRSHDLEQLDIADTRYGLGGVWLRFFTNSTGGAHTVPTAVSYQIARRRVTGSPDPQVSPPNPAEIRYMLFRSEVGGQQLLEDGYDLDDRDPSHYVNSNALGNLKKPANLGIIGNNVIDFGIRLYVRSPGAMDPIFPVTNYPVDMSYDDDHSQYFAVGSTEEPFPDVADIMVRVLTEEGARQIQHLESGRTYQNVTDANLRRELWWDIAETNSRVFTRRVFLNAKAY